MLLLLSAASHLAMFSVMLLVGYGLGMMLASLAFDLVLDAKVTSHCCQRLLVIQSLFGTCFFTFGWISSLFLVTVF